MSRLIGALLCACLLACGLGQAARAGPLQFAYKGAGCDGRKAMPSFEAVLGRKADGVVDFSEFKAKPGYTGPQAMSSSIGWGNWCWKGSGYKLAQSLPLAFSDTSLRDVAAGKADADYVKVAKSLVSNGFPDAYIRAGWEFNGGWYLWGGKDPAGFILAWKHVHDVMMAVPGARFRWVWNPALYMQGFWPDQGYPGDAYVDVIAVDAYGTAWGATVPATIVAHSVSDGTQWNVAHVVAFAKAHGKPYAFPEWATGKEGHGYGSGDYPPFITAMASYVAGAEFAGYWDFPATDYDGSFAHNPQAAAAFRTAFGPAPVAPAAVAAPAATLTAKIDHGGSVMVTPNADGSATLALGFPLSSAPVTYTITLSEARKLGFGNGKGGLSGALWNGGKPFASFTWAVSASTTPKPQVYAPPK